jgi:glyoxylate/hydroxypyruvate reductase A
MAMMFLSTFDRSDDWQATMATLAPDMDFRVWPDIGNKEDIEYALVWQPPASELKSYPNLKIIFSIGAGVDHLASDPDLPEGVPVCRMVDHALTEGMVEYVVMSALYHHKKMHLYAQQQREKSWQPCFPPTAEYRTIGVMGLGVLGGACVKALSTMGFKTLGWSRSDKEIEGVETFSGADGLKAFLNGTQILVCLLPLTDKTRGIINTRLLDALPKGACVINVGRGGHLIEEDLYAALQTGQIEAATLDVFQEEPLPQDSPLWSHARVMVTPHIASITQPFSATQGLLENIRRQQAGEELRNVVDFSKEY